MCYLFRGNSYMKANLGNNTQLLNIPPFIRAVAYHHTVPSMAASLRRQLKYFQRHYRCIVEEDLAAFFAEASAPASRGEKPGLIISFDDGLSQHYHTAAPLLEEYGFRGWFFVPAALPLMPTESQKAFCDAHDLLLPNSSETRIGINREELLNLKRRGHVIGCHTMNHRRFSGEVDAKLLDSEVKVAQDTFASLFGSPPRSFAWVGGEPETYNPFIQENLEQEGFTYSFTTMSKKIKRNSNPLMLHRTVLNADMPYLFFLAKIEGLSDLAHRGRRRAIEARLGVSSEQKA